MIFSSSSCLIAMCLISFLFIAEEYPIVYLYHMFINHQPVVQHLVCFYLLPIVNKTTVNMIEQISVEQDAQSFGHMLRCGMGGLHGIIIFSFLIIIQTDFNGAAPVCMHVHSEGSCLLPASLPAFAVSSSLDICLSDGVR